MAQAWLSPELHFPTVNRACQGCSRKKIKCDMRRPVCGLCERTGRTCVFPMRQKRSATLSQTRKALQSNHAIDFYKTVSHCCEGVSDQSQTPPAHSANDLQEITQLDSTTTSANLRQSVEDFLAPLQNQSNKVDLDHDAASAKPRQLRDLYGLDYSLDSEVLASAGDGWGISESVAYELVGLFFANIQRWLPLLHLPRFYDRYTRIEDGHGRIVDRQNVNNQEAILILGVFALAARFSTASVFANTEPSMRGDMFASRATILKDYEIKDVREPSLDFVKGCILLAFHTLGEGQTSTGALLVSVCVRFAYDLKLDGIDDDDDDVVESVDNEVLVQERTSDELEAWVSKEELRRVWWAIYELDTFASTLSIQPYGIERGEIKVLLPVSDENWFQRRPISSAHLNQCPGTIWKSLERSDNQTPRAWFLVTNYLKSCLADATRQTKRNQMEMREQLEKDLTCLRLAYPTNFQLSLVSMDDTNFGELNWILSTHLMVLACDSFLQRMKWSSRSRDTSFDVANEASAFAQHFCSRLIRIVQKWPPEYMPFSSPFIGCCFINPWDALVEGPNQPSVQSYELAKLLLTHYSHYWKIGAALIRLLNIIHEGNDSTDKYAPGSEERDIIRRFFVLCSHFKQGRNTLATTKPNTAQDRRCNTDDPHEPHDASIPTSNDFFSSDITNLGNQGLFFPHFWDDFIDVNTNQTNFDGMEACPGDLRTKAQKVPDGEDQLDGKRMSMCGWPSTDSFADYLMLESS